jgi:hypothetical protein
MCYRCEWALSKASKFISQHFGESYVRPTLCDKVEVLRSSCLRLFESQITLCILQCAVVNGDIALVID